MSKNLEKYKQGKELLDDQLAFKISKKDKKAFQDFCNKNKLKSGLILRDLLSNFMKENA